MVLPDDNELRRAFALWLTTTFLPSRVSDANVPTLENLEEVIPMIAEGSIDWTAEWREKGRKEGEAALLLRMLHRLHGPVTPEIEERVRDAETDQLLEWGERLVTVDSLEEIFESNGGG